MNRNTRNFLIAVAVLLVVAVGYWYVSSGGYLDNLFEWATGAETEDVLGGE